MTDFDRRKFLTYGASIAGLAALGRLALPAIVNAGSDEKPTEDGGKPTGDSDKPGAAGHPLRDGFGTQPVNGAKFGMVIDVGACVGCRTCTWACKQENNIADTISPLWIENFQLDLEEGLNGEPHAEDLKRGATTNYTESPTPGHWYMPAACNHCSNAPCVKVCPTGATSKESDGYVLIDYKRCIGCRLCVVACPYNARRFNWFKPEPPANPNPMVPVRPVGVVEKCTWCVHRTRRGLLPRCVESCPVGARHFGNFNDPESEVSKLIHGNQGFRLLTELNTNPNLWYITRGKKWYSK